MSRFSKVDRASTVAVAAALLALGAAGCGGGDETSTDTTQGTPLSKADFIAQADEICAAGSRDLEQAQQERFGDTAPSDAEGVAFVEEDLIPTLEQEANSIDELGPPDEDIDQVNAIVDALRSGIEELESDPQALIDGDTTAFEEANELANEYGLEVCGENG